MGKRCRLSSRETASGMRVYTDKALVRAREPAIVRARDTLCFTFVLLL